MKRYWIGVILFWLVIIPLAASSYQSLLTGADARGAAMGFTGIGSHPGTVGMIWNPALMHGAGSRDALLSVNRWIQGVQTGVVGYSQRNFGLSVHYTQIGEIEHRIGPGSQALGTFSANDFVASAGLSKQIRDDLFVGLLLKSYYEKIYVDESWGLGGDMGVIWQPENQPWRFGAVVQNVGRGGKLRDENVKLPLTVRAGSSYMHTGLGGQWTAALEMVRVLDSNTHMHAGLEWLWANRLALRAGYQTGYETRGLTAGFGMQFRAIRLGYAFIPFQHGLGDVHVLSLYFGE